MTNTLVHKQRSFSGGLQRLFDTTRRTDGAFPLLINGRVREDIVSPVNSPLEIDLPINPTRIQGIYSTDTLGVVFADGKCFYRNYTIANSSYVELPGFLMDSSVAVIYAELVPTSNVNYIRSATEAGGKVINLTNPISASDSCLVVQDTLNQPRVIFSNGTHRVLQTWDEWTVLQREYVPIGKQMLWDANNAIFYVVSPNGKRIYRSVTGRPLDFIIAVDVDGNKVGDISSSGAEVLAHTVSEESITALKISDAEGSFLACTVNNSWLVKPDFNSLIYGEPSRFINQHIFSTGAVNHFSVTSALGDTLLIDTTSIRSFNAILQARNEGRNSIFSRNIDKFFENVNQSAASAAAIEYNNYNLFSVNTVYGPAVMVYDNLTQQFVGLDIYAGLSQIKFLTPLKINNVLRLLAATSDNKLYELFAGSIKETAQLYVGDFVSGDPTINQKLQYFNSVWFFPFEAGTITAKVYVDGKLNGTFNFPVKDPISNTPTVIPFGQSTNDEVRNITFSPKTILEGYKVGVLLCWNFDVRLSEVQLECTAHKAKTDYASKAQNTARYGAEKCSVTEWSPATGINNTLVTVLGEGMYRVTSVTIGGQSVSFEALSDMILTINVGETSGEIQLLTPYDTIVVGDFTNNS